MVAGTTGSGKSELLISWCLSLAMQYSPDDLHFVFLDFKGGSTFNALEHLPHTVGNVCDLDLFHAIRALNAIEQELVRREALVSTERVSRFDQLVRPPARLVVVIDEFHALRDRLPDYMQRLNRLASLGRSLGMHLIVCTQYPMGQVHADMKANISLSICLRVTDQMQSNELIGIRDAALIPPSIPGAAYCNDGQHTTPFLCSAVRDVNRLVRNIGTAARFHACKRPDLLFSEPLTQHATQSDLSIPSNQSWHNVPFALADDGVLVYTAILDVSQQNIAIIGAYGSGKTNLLLHCARWLYDTGCANIRFTRKTEHGMVTDDGKPLPSHKRTIWIVDDADEALDCRGGKTYFRTAGPMSDSCGVPLRRTFQRSDARHSRRNSGRVRSRRLYPPRSWRAHATGQSMPYSVRGIPRFLTIRGILFAKTLEKSRDSWLSE